MRESDREKEDIHICGEIYRKKSKRNKDDNIHKLRSSKIMNDIGKKITLELCHTIIIKLDKIGKSRSL